MKKDFSKSWKSSKKPNKQRKFRFNAPLHIKGKFLNAHLSKELRQKYKTRALRLRLGDKVKIMRGQFKKQEGKIEEVDIKKSVVYVSKVEHTKRDGTKARYPIQPSNVMIVEINTDDKRRFKSDKPAKTKQKSEMSSDKKIEKINNTEKSAEKKQTLVKPVQKKTTEKPVEKKIAENKSVEKKVD
jgi:large subunit ribosomal protein L24